MSEKNALLESLKNTFGECLAIAEAKNKDYGGGVDPFNNFLNAKTVGVSVPRGILVRMMDKISRISTLLDREAEVKDESLFDTLDDLINYTAILKAYIEIHGKH